MSKKSRKTKKKQKNNLVRRIWSKSIPDCFFLFFWFSSFFSKFFGVPSPTVQKLEENQKKTILWEESWVSPFRIGFFGFFGLFGFSRGFCCPKPNCPKTRGKPKKTKKNNPVRRILGKSIQDWFFWFFWFIWFFSRFLLSQAQLSKNSRKTKKNKKNNPVRRILGKSIQDWFFWFFWFIWFFSRFLLSQAQLSKNWRQQNYFFGKEKIYIYIICIYIYKVFFTEPIIQLSI